MREHEDGVVIGRVVAPPTFPVTTPPLAADGPEHVAAHHVGADAVLSSYEEAVVDTGVAALLADHGAAVARLEDPLVQLLGTATERLLDTLVGARAVAVERDAEVVDAQLRHRARQLMTPWSRSPSISSGFIPSSVSTSTVCSP